MAEAAHDATHVKPYSIPNADAPELAPLGEYDIGVQVRSFTDDQRPNLIGAVVGGTSTGPRETPVYIWYPATHEAQAKRMQYTGRLPFRPGARPPEMPESYIIEGIAVEDATPAQGQKFPLVVVSHGYGNWPTFMSYLTENLASKGYIVAAIDHKDIPYTDFNSFNLSFGSTILNRSRDQRFVIDQLVTMADASTDGLGAVIDASNIGLIGYSMGGFGAISTAGAPYADESPSFSQIPASLSNGLMESDPEHPVHPALKAVVLMAPWGGTPANRAWSASALSKITVPLFFIAGDNDDVSGYSDGIRWIYDHSINAHRQMLVYENARHNVGGNPEPPIADGYFDLMDWFSEPVWRRDRITGINQHFVTAFMGLHLKGQSEMASFLAVQPATSNQSAWPLKLGGYVGGTYSSGLHDGKPYWKGFQRRFALGLEMMAADPE